MARCRDCRTKNCESCGATIRERSEYGKAKDRSRSEREGERSSTTSAGERSNNLNRTRTEPKTEQISRFSATTTGTRSISRRSDITDRSRSTRSEATTRPSSMYEPSSRRRSSRLSPLERPTSMYEASEWSSRRSRPDSTSTTRRHPPHRNERSYAPRKSSNLRPIKEEKKSRWPALIAKVLSKFGKALANERGDYSTRRSDDRHKHKPAPSASSTNRGNQRSNRRLETADISPPFLIAGTGPFMPSEPPIGSTTSPDFYNSTLNEFWKPVIPERSSPTTGGPSNFGESYYAPTPSEFSAIPPSPRATTVLSRASTEVRRSPAAPQGSAFETPINLRYPGEEYFALPPPNQPSSPSKSEAASPTPSSNTFQATARPIITVSPFPVPSDRNCLLTEHHDYPPTGVMMCRRCGWNTATQRVEIEKSNGTKCKPPYKLHQFVENGTSSACLRCGVDWEAGFVAGYKDGEEKEKREENFRGKLKGVDGWGGVRGRAVRSSACF